MTFKIGDEVEWESQSAGFLPTVKRGVVEGVVPAGTRPTPVSRNSNPGSARDHESYIVLVRGKGRYWPRVKHLRRASPQDNAEKETP